MTDAAEVLAMLTPPDIVRLTALPESLLRPEADGGGEYDDAPWLDSLLAYLLGERTWDTVVRAALETGDTVAALAESANAREACAELTADLEHALKSAFDTLRARIAERRTAFDEQTRALQGLDPNDINELLSHTSEFVAPEQMPRTREACEELRRKLEDLKGHEANLQAARELAAELAVAEWEALAKAARSAFERFAGRVEARVLPLGGDADIFCALPVLVLQRNVELLERIANGEPVDPAHLPTRSERPVRRQLASRVGQSPAQHELHEHEPSLLSRGLLNQSPPSGYIVEDLAGLERLREAARRVSESDRASLFLGAQVANATLRGPVVGQGLLEAGLRRLRSREGIHARRLLCDAFTYLAQHDSDADEAMHCAAHALAAACAWPRYVAAQGARGRSASIVEWLDQPRRMWAQLTTGPLLDALAGMWADELPPRVADRWLEVVAAEIGSDSLLFSASARRLVTFSNVRKRMNRVRAGVRFLLSDIVGSHEVDAVLGKLADELIVEEPLPAATRDRLTELASNARARLAELPTESAAPVLELKLLLPDTVEAIAQSSTRASRGEEPQLTIQPLVRELYPAERHDELELPILVHNSADTPANDLSVVLGYDGDPEIAPDKISDGTVHIGTLRGDSSHEAVFSISVPPDLDQRASEYRFRMELRVGEKRIHKGFSLKVRPSNREHRSSPYTPGPAVTGERFVGRDRELNRLVSSLTGDVEQRPIVVYGIRRIGKTSLLRQVMGHDEVIRRFSPIYWSVEDRPPSDTSAEFLIDLCEKIREAVPSSRHRELDFSRSEFRERCYPAFERFMSSLEALELDRPVLLLMDEFDNLLHNARLALERWGEAAMPPPTEAFQQQVFGALRKSLMTNRGLRLVLSGLPDILASRYRERLFGLLETVEVTPLTERDAEQIIAAAEPTMSVSKPARDALLRASGLQPYLLQVICNELFHRMKFTGRDQVAPFDVREIIEDKILPAEGYFTDYVELIGDDWTVLWGLARAHRDAPESRRFVSVDEVCEALQREGGESDRSAVADTLESLRDSREGDVAYRPLVVRDRSRSDRYRLVIGVLGEHLLRHGLYR